MRPPTERPRAAALATVAALVVSLAGCHRVLVPELHPPGDVPVAPARLHVLKAHMRSGELYVLDSWRVVADGERLEGTGERYSVERERLASGSVSIEVAEVALFETNQPEGVHPLGTSLLGVMTVVTGAVAAICVSDPKACFGSCPTFYVEGGSTDRPVAEGFSASFARALEARDVDALPAPGPRDHHYHLTMRNEALETHAVRGVRVLAVPRPGDGRVLAGIDGRFYPATEMVGPDSCHAEEGPCLAALAPGGAERMSPADPHDLATRETVEVAFAPVEGRVGLVIGARHTLLTTYLFYQSMAYFGSHAGEYLAALERGGPAAAARATALARALGGIEVEVAEGDGDWRPAGTFDEAGPIATDVQVLPFEAVGDGPLRVRLRLTRGHWRIDRLAVARLGDPIRPQRLEPTAVEGGRETDARARSLLAREDRYLVTFPGDTYRLSFTLPRAPGGLELFLESEGYYYEWMREDWLAEEDPEMASLVLSDPGQALRRMAGPFKRREPEMEKAFWASRFRREGGS